MYEKISTVIIFDGPKIFLEEKHRSRSAAQNAFAKILF
jgi:hypothetical protein